MSHPDNVRSSYDLWGNIVIGIIIALVTIGVTLFVVFFAVRSNEADGGGDSSGSCPNLSCCSECVCSDTMSCEDECYRNGCCKSCDCPEPTNGGPKWCGPPGAPTVCNDHCKILDKYSSDSTTYCCGDGCCEDCEGTIVYGNDFEYYPKGKPCGDFPNAQCKSDDDGHYYYDEADSKYVQCTQDNTQSEAFCTKGGDKCACAAWRVDGVLQEDNPYCA